MKIKEKIMLAFTAATLLMGGCATKQQEMTYSGFLQDYSNLTDGAENGPALVYKKPGVDFSQYHKVIVDKIVFYLKKDAEAQAILPDEMKELSDTFEKELIASINDAYPMVGTPGSDTIRVRIAITDVKAGRSIMGPVGAILPIGMAVNLVSNVSTGSSVSVGNASIEVAIMDSMSGEVLAKVVDHKIGSTYEKATFKGKWGHSKKAFQQWAQMLRKWLDEVHGK